MSPRPSGHNYQLLQWLLVDIQLIRHVSSCCNLKKYVDRINTKYTAEIWYRFA